MLLIRSLTECTFVVEGVAVWLPRAGAHGEVQEEVEGRTGSHVAMTILWCGHRES